MADPVPTTDPALLAILTALASQNSTSTGSWSDFSAALYQIVTEFRILNTTMHSIAEDTRVMATEAQKMSADTHSMAVDVHRLRELADTTGIRVRGPYDYLNVSLITDMLRQTDRMSEAKANIITPAFTPFGDF